MSVAAVLVVLRADTETGERIRLWFEQAGFTAGPLVGISFSVEAPRELLEERFPDFAGNEGTGAELRLDRLPGDVAADVQAVVSEAPPDFGPTSY
ncbi:hypothetical protein [Solirubrobacter deserti]|uniref:Uncharacterized protein n=1 Tax=Solirubrobacter deserti TaxID=2282478 RepID=A0ABT4RDK7_9ACTN|nr:hypothetical protein [Solirubrobacter deserti]MDA0136620.1 hypothetical protein [Solirubrobacter deserti]